MTSATATERVEIDFDVYNPFDADFVRDPWPVFDRMLTEYPVAYHTGINAWLIASHDLSVQVTRDERYSTQFKDWNRATPEMLRPPETHNLYDESHARSMVTIGPREHARMRRLTAPAFARRVHAQIEDRIRDSIAGIFDEIDDPAEFNVVTEISEKVPVRAIAAQVGVPAGGQGSFESLGFHAARAMNPMYAAEREQHIQGTLPGLQYLLDLIRERRSSGDPGNDFVGTLITTEIDGDSLDDMEILALIEALVVAGGDTPVDHHTTTIHTLLTHPEQRRLLRERPELMENATLELLRYNAFGKLGAIPRFAMEDIELGTQVVRTGDFVIPLLGVSFQDPAKWPEPRRFDITRDQSNNLIFGVGPHLCIGLNLVKAQTKLMIEEFERRFGTSAELVGDLEYDPMHFNSRRITSMRVRTAG